MPPNETLDTPAARGPEVRRSAISAFQFFSFSVFQDGVSAFLPLALFTVLWIDLIRQLSNIRLAEQRHEEELTISLEPAKFSAWRSN